MFNSHKSFQLATNCHKSARFSLGLIDQPIMNFLSPRTDLIPYDDPKVVIVKDDQLEILVIFYNDNFGIIIGDPVGMRRQKVCMWE